MIKLKINKVSKKTQRKKIRNKKKLNLNTNNKKGKAIIFMGEEWIERGKKVHQQQLSLPRLTLIVPTGWENLDTSNYTAEGYFWLVRATASTTRTLLYIYIYIKFLINANLKFFIFKGILIVRAFEM